jgi:hypothetical protein
LQYCDCKAQCATVRVVAILRDDEIAAGQVVVSLGTLEGASRGLEARYLLRFDRHVDRQRETQDE